MNEIEEIIEKKEYLDWKIERELAKRKKIKDRIIVFVGILFVIGIIVIQLTFPSIRKHIRNEEKKKMYESKSADEINEEAITYIKSAEWIKDEVIMYGGLSYDCSEEVQNYNPWLATDRWLKDQEIKVDECQLVENAYYSDEKVFIKADVIVLCPAIYKDKCCFLQAKGRIEGWYIFGTNEDISFDSNYLTTIIYDE